jgi:hypothetical protein
VAIFLNHKAHEDLAKSAEKPLRSFSEFLNLSKALRPRRFWTHSLFELLQISRFQSAMAIGMNLDELTKLNLRVGLFLWLFF